MLSIGCFYGHLVTVYFSLNLDLVQSQVTRTPFAVLFDTGAYLLSVYHRMLDFVPKNSRTSTSRNGISQDILREEL